jgi:bifunctional non-homologous end joining protein LigD
MVWDNGTYEVIGTEPLQALGKGKLHLLLKGRKLKGEWTLVRIRGDESKPQWLLMKTGEDAEPFTDDAENKSVLTRRTLAQIAHANGKEWKSNRAAKESQRPRFRLAPALDPRHISDASAELKRLPSAKADFVEPMKALLVEEIPKGSEWLYELKLDGIRALAIEQKHGVKLISRTAKDMTERYPRIAEALEKLPAREAVLDGEIVALDEQGRPSFQLLQSYHMQGTRKPPLFYYVFDLISLNGRDLRGLPLLKRKELAEELLKNLPDAVRFSGGLKANPQKVIKQMKQRRLEGLIAKKIDSKYESGRRSGAWQKFKWTNEQEFVIGGYTPPQGARSYFGAILVGYYEGDTLRFAAKVGTGFDHKMLASLHGKFQKLLRPNCPFANLPEKPGPGGRGFTLAEMRRTTWIEPKLICQVRFAEWTRDNHLRQPAFMGLREDKSPKEVIREKPENSSSAFAS